MINTSDFYNNYHGHTIDHLTRLYTHLKRGDPNKHFIYLAGDSSLDNKYWLKNEKMLPLSNGYESIIKPEIGYPDIAWHLNNLYKDYYTLNCAIEESSLGKRANGLLEQDIFISDHITNDDILIVSVGGNDIALSPSISTMYNMALLMYMNSLETLKKTPNSAWGFSHFVNLFKNEVKKYIMNIIGNKRPKRIIVCMIYYPQQTKVCKVGKLKFSEPDEQMSGSWADTTLGYLGYNKDPKKLQKAIEQIFYQATCKIKIDGSIVVPLPMFHYLNGKDSKDYVQRVEPSVKGGEKLAKGFIGARLYP